MKKEIISYETVCDLCGVKLTENNSISQDSIDLCNGCASTIFKTNIIGNISNDKLSGWINNIKNKACKRDVASSDDTFKVHNSTELSDL